MTTATYKLLIVLSASLSLGLAGCGSSDGDSGTNNNRTISGIAIDGPLNSSEIFIDRNGNGIHDRDSEFPTPRTTDSSGNFSFNFSGNGQLTVSGGIDATTNAPFRGIVQLDPSQTANNTVVISPLSSLIHNAGTASSTVIFNNLAGLDLQQVLSTNFLVANTLASAQQRTLLDLAVRYQKISETLAHAVMVDGNTTGNAIIHASSANTMLALALGNAANSTNTEAIFNSVNFTSISSSLGISAARQGVLNQRISSFNDTITDISNTTANANTVMLAGELLTQTIIEDVFSTNTQILSNAIGIVMNSTLSEVDVIQLANIINNNADSTRTDQLVNQAVRVSFPSTLTGTLVTLRGNDVISDDPSDTFDNDVTVYFDANGTNFSLCISDTNPSDNLIFSGTWERTSDSSIILTSQVSYTISLTPPTSSDFMYTAGSNLPIDGDPELFRIGIRTANAFSPFTTLPTVSSECPAIQPRT